MKKYIVAAAALICAPGIAYAQDSDTPNISGPRVEARVGWETPTVSDGTGAVYKVGQAVTFGGEIGFDIKAGSNVTVGAYANYDKSGVEVCDGTDCLGEDGNFSVGGRIGFVTGGNTVIYIKGGYNSIRMTAKSGGFTGSDTQGGIGGALGVEFPVARNVYAFVEGNYADYGDFYGINLQRRHVAGGLGVRF
ncbi:MAG: outer membrane protein [Sphingomonas sp.]|nr:outer membrane beta-barrel protein [Sphingomonas sp.]